MNHFLRVRNTSVTVNLCMVCQCVLEDNLRDPAGGLSPVQIAHLAHCTLCITTVSDVQHLVTSCSFYYNCAITVDVNHDNTVYLISENQNSGNGQQSHKVKYGKY